MQTRCLVIFWLIVTGMNVHNPTLSSAYTPAWERRDAHTAPASARTSRRRLRSLLPDLPPRWLRLRRRSAASASRANQKQMQFLTGRAPAPAPSWRRADARAASSTCICGRVRRTSPSRAAKLFMWFLWRLWQLWWLWFCHVTSRLCLASGCLLRRRPPRGAMPIRVSHEHVHLRRCPMQAPHVQLYGGYGSCGGRGLSLEPLKPQFISLVF